MAKVHFEITGDMPDGYAEIVLGIMLMSGLLKSQKMSKRKNPDDSYTVIVDIEGKLPPLGSLGLDDIPDEKAEKPEKQEEPDLSFTAHDDATSHGCKMCGNEWKSLNKQGYCSSCWTVWNS